MIRSERYVITDGLVFVTRTRCTTSMPALAAMYAERPDAVEMLARVRPMLGTDFTIKRLNLNTMTLRGQ
jgi:hypothetical protein